MCIAIWKPRGKEVSKNTLRECWRGNPHGMGFAFAKGGRLYVHKELFDFEAWYKKYQEMVEADDLPAIIHFRLATHGVVDIDNCHPFLVHKDLAVVHNGIINVKETGNGRSDTWHFVEILKKLPRKCLDNVESLSPLLKLSIGSSKLIFLNNSGEATIVNEDDGVWDGGVWYSNTAYKRSRYFYDWDEMVSGFRDLSWRKYRPIGLCQKCENSSIDLVTVEGLRLCRACKTSVVCQS